MSRPVLTLSSVPPQTGSSCSTDSTPSNPPSYSVDEPAPVDLAQAGHPVAPPAHVPGVGPVDGLAGPAVAVAPLGKDLDVFGLGVGDPVQVRRHRGDGV